MTVSPSIIVGIAGVSLTGLTATIMIWEFYLKRQERMVQAENHVHGNPGILRYEQPKPTCTDLRQAERQQDHQVDSEACTSATTTNSIIGSSNLLATTSVAIPDNFMNALARVASVILAGLFISIHLTAELWK